jgi:hypothetical protein
MRENNCVQARWLPDMAACSRGTRCAASPAFKQNPLDAAAFNPDKRIPPASARNRSKSARPALKFSNSFCPSAAGSRTAATAFESRPEQWSSDFTRV